MLGVDGQGRVAWWRQSDDPGFGTTPGRNGADHAGGDGRARPTEDGAPRRLLMAVAQAVRGEGSHLDPADWWGAQIIERAMAEN